MSKKRPNNLYTMSSSLLIISGIAAICLAFVYEITKEPISQVAQKKTEKAILEVVPPFDSLSKVKVPTEIKPGDSLTLFYAYNKKTKEIVGVAVETYTEKGFSGLIKVMVGFKPDLSINGTKVLEHKETPGLGTKMEDKSFKTQFVGKNPANFKLIVKKDGGDVDAITAATISSRAFCDALDLAYKVTSKHLQTINSSQTKEGGAK